MFNIILIKRKITKKNFYWYWFL